MASLADSHRRISILLTHPPPPSPHTHNGGWVCVGMFNMNYLQRSAPAIFLILFRQIGNKIWDTFGNFRFKEHHCCGSRILSDQYGLFGSGSLIRHSFFLIQFNKKKRQKILKKTNFRSVKTKNVLTN